MTLFLAEVKLNLSVVRPDAGFLRRLSLSTISGLHSLLIQGREYALFWPVPFFRKGVQSSVIDESKRSQHFSVSLQETICDQSK